MEWIVVGVIVVVLFFGGAKKIPQLASSLGRVRGEFERGKMEVEKEIREVRETPAVKESCSNCGKEMAGGESFCPGCGTAPAKAPAA
jgi:sec-independent protein translocase protein TatA